MLYNRFYLMFKRMVAILTVLSFAIWVLLASLSKVTTAKLSYATASLEFSVSATSAPTIAVQPKIEYFLAYPGILPDNPLYKIKMIRDKVWLWLTTEKVRRAELYLLYADKRVGAGKVLVEGNQVPLGISTLTKGEKYLEKAIEETKRAKTEGRKTDSLEENIKKASLKYEEILTDLQEKVNAEGKAGFDDLLKSLKNLQERAQNL